jgi:hypothetical protein
MYFNTKQLLTYNIFSSYQYIIQQFHKITLVDFTLKEKTIVMKYWNKFIKIHNPDHNQNRALSSSLCQRDIWRCSRLPSLWDQIFQITKSSVPGNPIFCSYIIAFEGNRVNWNLQSSILRREIISKFCYETVKNIHDHAHK